MIKTLHFQCKNMGSIPFKENKMLQKLKTISKILRGIFGTCSFIYNYTDPRFTELTISVEIFVIVWYKWGEH